MRAGRWKRTRGRGWEGKKRAHSNDGVHRPERKWNKTAKGAREQEKNTQENKGECLKGQAMARYIEHAVGKWRECTFACDILLRHAAQSKTGRYANVRQLRQYNLYLSHFTCSAHQSLYIQRELHSIQVYRLNIQLIKINEIYLEKNMLLL